MGTATIQIDDIARANHILLAIFENLRSLNNKRQLFMKVNYYGLQDIFYKILGDGGQYLSGGLYFKFEYLKHLFVFSKYGPISLSPVLQSAIQQLQFAGMICWPDLHEPDLMRLNPGISDYYEMVLLRNTPERLAYQDVISAQEIAKTINAHWQKLVVDRNHLMNLKN